MASASGRERAAPSSNLESQCKVTFPCLGAGEMFRHPCPFPVTQVNFSVLRSLKF